MSDESDSIQESLKSAVKERLGNPLIGSFAISWAVTNWEFLAILIRGDAKIEDKLTALHAGYMTLPKMVYIPVMAAVLLTVSYPWIDWVIRELRSYPHLRKQRSELKAEIAITNLRKELSEKKADLAEIERLEREKIEEARRHSEEAERSELLKVQSTVREAQGRLDALASIAPEKLRGDQSTEKMLLGIQIRKGQEKLVKASNEDRI